ncbi:Mobile element protein [Azospirillum melinis]
MKCFRSARHVQHFLSINDPINNLVYFRRESRPASGYRTARAQVFATWAEVVGALLAAA